jgi:hypothetical protein
LPVRGSRSKGDNAYGAKSLFGKAEGQTVLYALMMRKTFEPREYVKPGVAIAGRAGPTVDREELPTGAALCLILICWAQTGGSVDWCGLYRAIRSLKASLSLR